LRILLRADSGFAREWCGGTPLLAASTASGCWLKLARDITAIEKLWAHESYVFVVHPSSKVPEIGWENVRSSFGTQVSRYSEFVVSMTETKVHVNGDTAFVVGLEAFTGKRVNGDTVEGKAIGTRGFERKSGQWLVVFHQATPVR
jgi:ketosteroid isomerase-like protein